MAQLPPTNQVILTGEVTEEPTIHYLAPDFPEVHLRLKTEEQVTGREGGKSYTQRLWHRIVARGSTGMLLEQAHGGSILSRAGRIEYAREVDRSGTSTLVPPPFTEEKPHAFDRRNSVLFHLIIKRR